MGEDFLGGVLEFHFLGGIFLQGMGAVRVAEGWIIYFFDLRVGIGCGRQDNLFF